MGLSRLENLKRGVGRKIVLLFLAAGLVPVLFTAALSLYEFNRSTETRAFQVLTRNAKSYGVDIFTRLSLMSDKAAFIADQLAASDSLSGGSDYLMSDFDAIWLQSSDGLVRPLYGDRPRWVGAPAEARRFEPQSGTFMEIADRGNSRDILLLRPVDSGQDGSYLVFRIKPPSIWGGREELPFNTHFCVFTSAGEILHCTSEKVSDIHSLVASADDRALTEWGGDERQFASAMWQLFLKAQFDGPSLDIVASQPSHYALQSGADSRRIYLPAMMLVLLLVIGLSFRAIGHSLNPLRTLTNAATRVAGGDLSQTVDIQSKDEFAWLGQAFNNMTNRLRRQFNILESMSEIDRLILTGADLDAVCVATVRHLQRLSGAYTVAVLAATELESGTHARLATMHGDDIDSVAAELAGDLADRFSEAVVLSVMDPALEPLGPGFFDCQGLTHLAVVPVRLQDSLQGVLLVGGNRKDLLGRKTLAVLNELASHFAVALNALERESQLFRQANFDELTGLPNRQLLKAQLARILQDGMDASEGGALLYLDLDRFKEINDVFGHSVGDIVLCQAAERITSTLGKETLVARLGGDEFIAVLPGCAKEDHVERTANQLINRMTEVFSVFGVDHYLGVSIGVVLYPDDGANVEVLMKNADAAMYRAKDAGRARFEFFNAKLNDDSRRKIKLEKDLRSSAREGHLELYYQPQYHLNDSNMHGAEALLRWDHPTHGFVSPSEFICLAEESDLIVDIGRQVLASACRDMRTILDKGLDPGMFSVNVSTRQLRDGELVDDVMNSLRSHDLQSSMLRLEVTETALAQNKDFVHRILSTLRDEGVRIAIDDFGTGYSSLSYLQHLPFDEVKIDKSFVDKIETDASSASICTTIIKMSHELGKTTVAEGVETTGQLEFLQKHGCDVVQGYLYSRPLPFEGFESFVRKLDFHTQRRRALKVL